MFVRGYSKTLNYHGVGFMRGGNTRVENYDPLLKGGRVENCDPPLVHLHWRNEKEKEGGRQVERERVERGKE